MRSNLSRFGIILALCCVCTAQQWNGILSPSRAIDWSATNPGVIGGIPSGSWTQCGSTIAAYTGTVVAINNAIAACGANQYVQLGAGTFTITNDAGNGNTYAIVMKSNMALRAVSGATNIVFSGPGGSAVNNCNSSDAGICFAGDNTFYGSANIDVGGTQSAAWTAGYAQGATSLTLGSIGSTGIINGQYIVLDQVNDLSNVGVVNTQNSSTGGCASNCVSWVSGSQFSNLSNGQNLIINSVQYVVTTVNSATLMTLSTAPGTQSSVTYGAVPASFNAFTCTDGPPSVGGTCSIEGGSFGRCAVGAYVGCTAGYRSQVQVVKVVSGCPTTCTGSATITITPGLAAPTWRSGQTPGAWWPTAMITNAGIENLSIDTTGIADATADWAGIEIDNANNVWVKGIRSIRGVPRRDHIQVQDASHVTVQDSYFYSNGTAASSEYAIESLFTSDTLFQNNIFQQVGPLMNSPNVGAVWAYNFVINQPTSPANYNSAGNYEHDAGVQYVLFEGNIGPGFTCDDFHGNANFATLFRNRYTGLDTGKAQNRTAVELWSYCRYHNIVANVLGAPGFTTYIANPGGQGSDLTIYGVGGGDGTTDDAQVLISAMLWGNYDTFNAANRFVTGENGSGASTYPALASPSSTFPASFYLTAKPAWWTFGLAWPPIGPDVSSGTLKRLSGGSYAGSLAMAGANQGGGSLVADAGSEANPIPAMQCALVTMGMPPDGSGSVLPFNASTCYPTTPIPSAPTVVPFVFNYGFCGTMQATKKRVCCKNGTGMIAAVAVKSWTEVPGAFSANCRVQ